jgi:hypothetical protein
MTTIQQEQGRPALVAMQRGFDEPRPEGRVRMHVWFNGIGAAFFDAGLSEVVGSPEGSLVRRPKNIDQAVELLVYESDVPAIEAWTEDRMNAYPVAVEAYRRELKRFLAEAYGNVQADVPDDPKLYNDAAKRLSEEFGGSVEREFARITGRTPRPLRDTKVVERGLPPPLTIDERRADAYHRARANAGAVDFGDDAEPSDDRLAAVMARLDKLEAENADLREQLGAAPPKKSKLDKQS